MSLSYELNVGRKFSCQFVIDVTAVTKQSMTPLYAVGLFIILVLITSAGVPIVAATSPAVMLK